MIERHYGQRRIAEGLFTEPLEDCWEPWIKQADEILDDEQLINTVSVRIQRVVLLDLKWQCAVSATILVLVLVHDVEKGQSLACPRPPALPPRPYRTKPPLKFSPICDFRFRISDMSGLAWSAPIFLARPTSVLQDEVLLLMHGVAPPRRLKNSLRRHCL
jgi:hypothetical protein